MNINYIFFPIVFILISILSFSPFGVKQNVWFCKSDNSKKKFIISYNEDQNNIKSEEVSNNSNAKKKYTNITFKEPYMFTDEVIYNNKLFSFYFLPYPSLCLLNKIKGYCGSEFSRLHSGFYDFYIDINLKNNRYRLFYTGELIIDLLKKKSCTKVTNPVLSLLEEGICEMKELTLHKNFYNRKNVSIASNDKAFDGCVIFE